MTREELQDRARKLTIWAEKLAVSFSPGSFLSFFHGQGMEYEESRQYVLGDDVRRLDWKVTARTQAPYVKIYREERELNLLVVLDVSRSLFYGSKERMKIDVASELAAMLALIAENRGDRVGMVLFSDRVHYVNPPAKDKGRVRSMVEHVLENRSAGLATSIEIGVAESLKLLKKRSFVLVISDFLDQNYEKSLKKLSSRHDVVAARICDVPIGETFQKIGLGVLNIETSQGGGVDNIFDSKGEIREWKLRISRLGARPFVVDTQMSTVHSLHRFMSLSRRRRWMD